VVSAMTSDGIAAVLKVGIPGPSGFETETRHCAWPPVVAMPAYCVTTSSAARCSSNVWVSRSNASTTRSPVRSKSSVQRYGRHGSIFRPRWRSAAAPRRRVGSPTSSRRVGASSANRAARAQARTFSAARQRAFEHTPTATPTAATRCSGWAPTLGSRWSTRTVCAPNAPCDLAVPMRGWTDQLLAGDPLLRRRERCAFISDLTGVEPDAIWQWGFLECMSTGLYMLRLGWRAPAHALLRVADAWTGR
jgi:hypothetical protein